MQKPMISVRRRSTLAQTIRTENWLRDMSQKGFFLRQVSGTNYRFEQGEPRDVRYFLMSPEIGSNSDSWVFYEFERKNALYASIVPMHTRVSPASTIMDSVLSE